jgi:hypothetical protein
MSVEEILDATYMLNFCIGKLHLLDRIILLFVVGRVIPTYIIHPSYNIFDQRDFCLCWMWLLIFFFCILQGNYYDLWDTIIILLERKSPLLSLARSNVGI